MRIDDKKIQQHSAFGSHVWHNIARVSIQLSIRTTSNEMTTATSSSQRKERKHLTLKEKVEVIRKSDTNPKMTLRELAKCFSCGKMQISGILKAKDDILALYEANRSDTLQLTRKRARN